MLSATDDVNHRAHRSHVELGMSETLSFQKCQRCHSALPRGCGGEPCTPPAAQHPFHVFYEAK